MNAETIIEIPVAHHIFNDEHRNLWPIRDLGFVEESAIGGPLAMCGGCGNVVNPAEECEGCGCKEPGRETLPCNAEGCEGGFVTTYSWTEPTREDRCPACGGTGRIAAPYAHFRSEFDLGIENDLEVWAQAGLDLSCVVTPPKKFPSESSLYGWQVDARVKRYQAGGMEYGCVRLMIGAGIGEMWTSRNLGKRLADLRGMRPSDDERKLAASLRGLGGAA